MPVKKTFCWYLIILALVVTSCNNTSNDSEENTLEDTTTVTSIDLSEDMMSIMQSIPSPLEMTSLIKESGAKYNEQILNSPENVKKYNTNYQQALNMGVYGADLTYINIYEKPAAIEYLNAVNKLATALKVNQFFDFAKLKSLAGKSSNADSLLYETTTNFNEMDAYLRDQKRSELSALVIAGAWLEGLHIATEVASANKSKEIIERIGEQKINLDNVMLILNNYKKDPYFANLLNDFQALNTAFDQVTITYDQKEAETKEVDGQLVVVDNSTSTVNITDEQLNNIISITKSLRSKIIGA